MINGQGKKGALMLASTIALSAASFAFPPASIAALAIDIASIVDAVKNA